LREIGQRIAPSQHIDLDAITFCGVETCYRKYALL